MARLVARHRRLRRQVLGGAGRGRRYAPVAGRGLARPRRGVGVMGELITLAGAEPLDAAWRGWWRDTVGFAGRSSWWTSGGDDTLTSPVVDLRGHAAVWLQFWTRHYGSVYTPEQRGIVQFSSDSGRTWSDVHEIIGDG